MEIFSVISYLVTVYLFLKGPVGIYEGDNVTDGYHFMASLLIKTPSNPGARCSAILIMEDVLITSKHCLHKDGINFEVLSISLGSYNYNERYLVRYLRDENPIVWMDDEDIGLLFLKPVDSYYGFPIEITGISNVEPAENEEVQVAGWGIVSEGMLSESLLSCSMKRFINPLLSPSQIEFRDDFQGGAPGDSGGPVMFNNKLAGIISKTNPKYREWSSQRTVAVSINYPPVVSFLNANGIFWK